MHFNQKVLVLANFKIYVSSVSAILRSQTAFIKSMKSNLNGSLWSCINNVEFACAQITPFPFSLIGDTGDDTHLFNDPSPDKGLDFDVEACSGYPSIRCPFRYELSWHAECQTMTPTCQSPDIFLEGHLKISKQANTYLLLNTTNFDMLVRLR